MKPAGSSRETPKNEKQKQSPGVLAGAKAPRLHAHPRLRRSAGMTLTGSPRIWGARRRKGSGLAFPPPNFARNLRTPRAPRKAAASGRPGPASLGRSRRAGPATPRADPAAPQLCGGRTRSLASPLHTRRPPARSLARLSAAAARAAAATAPSRRVTPPAETRAVSWTVAPALPISAARGVAPTPGSSRSLRTAGDTRAEAEGPGHRPRRRDAATSSVNRTGSRATVPFHPLGDRVTNGLLGDCVTLFYFKSENKRQNDCPTPKETLKRVSVVLEGEM